MPLFGSIVASGAGLHVAAYYLGHEAHIGRVATVLTVAAPVAIFIVVFYAGHSVLTRIFDSFHILLLVVTGVTIVTPVMIVLAEVDLAWCLLVLSLAPWVTVLGYETVAYRHTTEVLRRVKLDPAQ
jgi:hypothetical protein